jgi:hypothetical protein
MPPEVTPPPPKTSEEGLRLSMQLSLLGASTGFASKNSTEVENMMLQRHVHSAPAGKS